MESEKSSTERMILTDCTTVDGEAEDSVQVVLTGEPVRTFDFIGGFQHSTGEPLDKNV